MSAKTKNTAAPAPKAKPAPQEKDPLVSTNDAMLWRASLTKERYNGLKVDVTDIVSAHKECSINITDPVLGRDPRVIFVPSHIAGGVLHGNGIISDRSTTKHPAEATFYAVQTKRLPPAMLQDNPKIKEDLDLAYRMIRDYTLAILEKMYDTGKIKVGVRAECIREAMNEVMQLWSAQGKKFDKKDIKESEPEVRAIALKKWFKKANWFNNPKQDNKNGEENAEITADSLDESAQDPAKKDPESIILSQNAWIVGKKEKIEAHRDKFTELLNKSEKKLLTPAETHALLLEAGFIYKPIEWFMKGSKTPLREEQKSALNQKLTNLRAAMRKSKNGKIDDVAFVRHKKEAEAVIDSPFTEWAPINSIVQFKIYPEAYANKGKDGPWGVRWKIDNMGTIFKKGEPTNKTPMINSDDAMYTNTDTADAYNDMFDFNDGFFGQVVPQAENEENDEDDPMDDPLLQEQLAAIDKKTQEKAHEDAQHKKTEEAKAKRARDEEHSEPESKKASHEEDTSDADIKKTKSAGNKKVVKKNRVE